MLIKVVRGSDPNALCRYVLDVKKQNSLGKQLIEQGQSITPILVCSNVPGQDVEQLIRSFRLIAKLNAKVRKTVAHYALSLAPEEAERVDKMMMTAISEAMLYELGHQRCPYFGVQHHDAAQKHWHVVASTVAYDGTWVNDSFERKRLRTIERQLCQEFQLTIPEARAAKERKNLSTGEYRLKRRTGEKLPKEKLWDAIDSCAKPAISMPAFILTLRVKHPEISIRFKEENAEKVGISFGLGESAFTGAQLGRAYSLGGLSQHLGIMPPAGAENDIDQVLALDDTECREVYADFLERSTPQKQTADFER